MRKITIVFLVFIILSSTIAYADSNPYRDGYIEGYIKGINNYRITIETYKGDIYELNLRLDAQYMIDGGHATLSDFKKGMEVYGKLTGKTIYKLEGYSGQNPGYIEEGERNATGTIKEIDRNQLILDTNKGQKSYYTTPQTIATKSGQKVDLSILYTGDNVTLYFDEMNTDLITRIEIQNKSNNVSNIYKGKLVSSNNIDNTVVINNVKVFNNGKWKEVNKDLKLKYNNSSKIYTKGYELKSRYLKYYDGKEVIIVAKDFFGNDKIEKMVIKNMYESIYNESIKDINWYSETMELENNQNISFNRGTIVVKSGRVLDSYSINQDSDVFISAEGIGNKKTADLVYVYNEGINNSNIGDNKIYSAKFDRILENRAILEEVFMIENNRWLAFDEDEEKELYYDNDTYIYDLDNKKIVQAKELYSSDYSVDEDSRRAEKYDLEDWYGYIYTEENRMSSIILQEDMDSLLRQRITTGEIADIDNNPLVGKILTLSNTADFSRVKERWMPKTVDIMVSVEDALIIKDNKVITKDDLKNGDKLYIIRDDFDSKIVIVK